MRIAFVGKGGSGKTTLSALFSQYILSDQKPVAVFDADLNMHLPELLGFSTNVLKVQHLSQPESVKVIKNKLKGNRTDIPNLAAFRKTTPPSRKSNLIHIKTIDKSPIKDFFLQKDNLHLFIVGTYEEEKIGTSCYHNNLAIFENILSHLIDEESYVIADMVAGVDAFANTLHAQFDLLCLVVEPTKRSLEVYDHYRKLAKEAGTEERLVVIANKIRSKTDKQFIERHISKEKLIGILEESEYLRSADQTGGTLDISKLEKTNLDTLSILKSRLEQTPTDAQMRLEKLWELHKAYVAQDFVRERFGDLTNQIDTSFSFNDAK